MIYKGYLWGSMQLRIRRRLQKMPSCEMPLVYYGQDHVPGKEENACGGIIKIQDLNATFPNRINGANILYLVSSRLHAFAVEMARYAKSKGVKLVLNQNGTAYPAWHGPGWEMTNRPLRAMLELADYVVYQSDFCKKAADLHLVPRDSRFEIMHNPVDTTEFVPAQKRPSGHRLISFGTHNQFYRVKCALEAVAILKDSLPDIHLTFAGQYHWRLDHDLARTEIVGLAKMLNVQEHITIYGAYAQKEIVPLLHEHHIALHTKYNDPCPRSVVEAMACGLPVVYSKTGGVPELVGETGGVGVKAPLDWQNIHAPDPDGIAQAILHLFNHFDMYSRAARLQSVDKLDVRPWIQRHDIIFKRLLDER